MNTKLLKHFRILEFSKKKLIDLNTGKRHKIRISSGFFSISSLFFSFVPMVKSDCKRLIFEVVAVSWKKEIEEATPEKVNGNRKFWRVSGFLKQRSQFEKSRVCTKTISKLLTNIKKLLTIHRNALQKTQLHHILFI